MSWFERRTLSETEANIATQLDGQNYPLPKVKSKHTLRMQWLLSDSWTLDCLAMAIAATALVCIAVMLGIYNEKPLSSWSHKISLNTALSTLGTAMKGFMLIPVGSCLGQLKWLWYADQKRTLKDFEVFDDASRGPWGSTLLLIRLRLWHLASIGAFVTLLALASDSFVQQSVNYPLWNAKQMHLTASVPYTENYTAYDNGTNGPADGVVKEPIMAAIYDGVFSTNLTRSSSSLEATCSSGNCTFIPYASLGVCSRCADVTSHLKLFTAAPTQLGKVARWVLPNGLELNSVDTSIGYLNISATQEYAGTNMMQPQALNSDHLLQYISNGTISNISIISGTVDANNLKRPVATDCTLFFCARSYNSSSSFNQYHEEVHRTLDTPLWNWSGVNEYSNTGLEWTFEASFPEVSVENLTFGVNGYATRALSVALANIQGTDYTSSGAQELYTSDIVTGFSYHGLTGEAVVKTIENVASALTNAMRQLSGTTIQGTSYALEIHIHVQWFWLILPLVMILLAAVFLVATILQTKRSGIPCWRSSVLAVMEHGVNTTRAEDGQPDAEKIDMPGVGDGKETYGELEDWAKDVHVRLQRRGRSACGFGLSVS